MATAASTTPELFHRFRFIAYLLVVLSVAGFSYAESNGPLLALTVAAAVISWLLIESRPRSNGLPRPVINVGVLVVAGILFSELVFSYQPNLLLSLGHFMTGILLCKLFERKAVRDFAQMLTLTLLIMVAGAIFSASLTFAVLLIVYLVMGLYAILLLHLHAETEAARGASLLTLTPAGGQQGRTIRHDIRKVAFTSSILLTAVAAVVFLAIPRTRGQGLFSNRWSTEGTFQTGFTDHVRFTDYGSIQQSDAMVMEVRIQQDGANAGSEYFQPYFRGMVLDNYDSDERQWSSRPHRPAEPLAVSPDHPIALAPPEDYESIGMVEQQYTMHTTSTASTLFTISPAVDFGCDRDVEVQYNPRDWSLSLQNGPSQPLHYWVHSAMILKNQPLEPLLIPEGSLGFALRGERGNARLTHVPAEVMRLARSLVMDILPSDGKIQPPLIHPVAERFAEYLRANYPYSLHFEAKDRTLDPTADFLLNRKDTGGHCEYFASAMVMLCRSVGINARMVTGYHGGDFNSISGNYVVRQKHAHAWAEVYLPNRGWTLFDPSPVGNDVASTSVVTKWLSDASEVIQKAWQTTIIAFDNSSRTYLFSMVKELVSWVAVNVRSVLGDFGEGLRDLFLSPENTSLSTRITCAVTVLIMCAMAFWLIRHWHRRRTSPLNFILRKVDPRVQRQLAHELLFFDELLRLLARTGPRKRLDQTPREYIETLAPALRTAAPDARWLINTFYDVRFGTLRVSSTIRAQIAAALRHVRDQLHRPA